MKCILLLTLAHFIPIARIMQDRMDIWSLKRKLENGVAGDMTDLSFALPVDSRLHVNDIGKVLVIPKKVGI
jgi:hypothetical protein